MKNTQKTGRISVKYVQTNPAINKPNYLKQIDLIEFLTVTSV